MQIILTFVYCLCVFKGEEKSKYELMGSCGQQRFLQEAEGEYDVINSDHQVVGFVPLKLILYYSSSV